MLVCIVENRLHVGAVNWIVRSVVRLVLRESVIRLSVRIERRVGQMVKGDVVLDIEGDSQ